MADRPILFSATMVRALLAGTKSQTRRLLKPQPSESGVYADIRSAKRALRIMKGDRLWVRESVQAVVDSEDYDAIHYLADRHVARSTAATTEEAERYACQLYDYRRRKGAPDRKTGVPVPSIHMPRWASRMTLTVTDVRVQRLQDISEWDARAEGAYVGKVSGRVADDQVTMVVAGVWFSTALGWYADLWDRINGAGSWAANPWVVAYTFKVERRNIDEVPG